MLLLQLTTIICDLEISDENKERNHGSKDSNYNKKIEIANALQKGEVLSHCIYFACMLERVIFFF